MKNLFSYGAEYTSNLAAKALCQQVFNDLNIDLEQRVKFDIIKSALFDCGTFEETFKISTSTLGAFGPAIESMEVTIISNNNWSAEEDNNKKLMGIVYHYSYSLTGGGSNGNRVQMRFDYKGNQV